MKVSPAHLQVVKRAEIEFGVPLSWSLYNAGGELLLARGERVETEHQLETLSEDGLFRDRRERMAVIRESLETAIEEKHKEAEEPATQHVPLEEIRLMPGDALHLQSFISGQTERYVVRLIGIMKPKSVLVTAPMLDGKLIFVREGQPFQIRAFSGLNVCAFKASVLKANSMPFPYLHLSYPDVVEAMQIRRAMRANVQIIASVHRGENSQKLAAGRIIDLSVGGARLVTQQEFARQGEVVLLVFKVKLDSYEEYVQAPAVLRSVRQEAGEDGQPMLVNGLQFVDLSNPHRWALMALVYQHMLKEIG